MLSFIVCRKNNNHNVSDICSGTPFFDMLMLRHLSSLAHKLWVFWLLVLMVVIPATAFIFFFLSENDEGPRHADPHGRSFSLSNADGWRTVAAWLRREVQGGEERCVLRGLTPAALVCPTTTSNTHLHPHPHPHPSLFSVLSALHSCTGPIQTALFMLGKTPLNYSWTGARSRRFPTTHQQPLNTP